MRAAAWRAGILLVDNTRDDPVDHPFGGVVSAKPGTL
jgi:hypothetical protein